MNQTLLDNLYYPFWALLGASLCIYLLQTYHKRRMLKTALLAEINLLLSDVREAKNYLDSDGHYWLQEGFKVATAPLDTMPPARFYHAAVSELYLLRKTELEKALKF